MVSNCVKNRAAIRDARQSFRKVSWWLLVDALANVSRSPDVHPTWRVSEDVLPLFGRPPFLTHINVELAQGWTLANMVGPSSATVSSQGQRDRTSTAKY